jgi:hypothetical protein
VSIENQWPLRKFRIDEILSLEREPAAEAWRRIEVGGDEVSITEKLGYPIEYFRILIAQEFVRKLSLGESFAELPKLTPELEVLCWNAVAAQVKRDLPAIIDSPLCIEFRLKLISIYRGGVPIRDIVNTFGLDMVDIEALLMLALGEEGLTLDELGDEFGFSGERARQILKRFGVSTRDIKKQLRVQEGINHEQLSQAIDSWITTHPGCRMSEVSTALMISESDVMSLCPQDTKSLILGVRKKYDGEKYRTYSKTQTLDALRHAFDLRNPSMSMYSVSETSPLTGPFYQKLRSEGVVHGPSQPRIIQVFGTWKAACEEAGVPCVEAIRDFYELRWTNDELIGQLAEFILNSKSRSVESFDAWSRLDNSRASSGTIRNQIGAWSESVELALLLLRQQWTSDET